MKTSKKPSPPRLAVWLVKRLERYQTNHAIVDDMQEVFTMICQKQSIVSARLWYWGQSLDAVIKNTLFNLAWRLVMFKNYLKIAVRNIRRHKGFTFINIIGLSISIACIILILLYVHYEVSFDDYHQDVDRIYRVALNLGENEIAAVSGPLAATLKNDYPEVEYAAGIFRKTKDIYSMERPVVRYKDKKFYEPRVVLTTSDMFKIFNIHFLKGNPDAALDGPGKIVLTRKMSEKYFGTSDPLGEVIQISGDNYEVTGIVADPPSNTHLKCDFIGSLESFKEPDTVSEWTWCGLYTYVKLTPSSDPLAFEEKIRNIADGYIKEYLNERGWTYTYFLQPVRKIHLYSHLGGEYEKPGSPTYIYLLSALGVFILMIACFNYVNLSTARAAKRAKEVAVRKVIGAQRLQLIRQFLGESILLSLLSTIMAIFLARLALPVLNGLTQMNFTMKNLFHTHLLAIVLGLSFFIGILAGIYPALFLSLFKPESVFKSHADTSLRKVRFRRILVTSQFCIAVFLIIGTLVIYKQLFFMKNYPLGFDKAQKIIVPARLRNDYETVKKEFLGHPSIIGATASWSAPGRSPWFVTTRLIDRADNKEQGMHYQFVDYDFISEYGMKMIAGREFQRTISGDEGGSVILNETAVKAFGWTPMDAVGKRIQGMGREAKHIREVIGVVRDFHFQGLQKSIEPMVMMVFPRLFNTLTLTVRTDQLRETLFFIKKQWKELHLGEVFSYYFLDEDFNRYYLSEEMVGRLFSVFTNLAIFLSCLGLFGLASFTAEQRTKEIGIRRVLGASLSGVVILLTKEFVRLVAVANIIAWPAAYYAMNKWLHNFAYRIDLELWMFVISALLALFIALFTVSYQSIKAATANPVDSLRYE
jgi:putative ABC transport system permease protein